MSFHDPLKPKSDAKQLAIACMCNCEKKLNVHIKKNTCRN